MVGYLNLSRLLLRWMEQIHLPRSAIRMRYVHLVHAYHVLDRSCTHDALMHAMQTLLLGYVSVDEGDHSAQYYRWLRRAIRELQCLVRQYADNA